MLIVFFFVYGESGDGKRTEELFVESEQRRGWLELDIRLVPLVSSRHPSEAFASADNARSDAPAMPAFSYAFETVVRRIVDPNLNQRAGAIASRAVFQPQPICICEGAHVCLPRYCHDPRKYRYMGTPQEGGLESYWAS